MARSGLAFFVVAGVLGCGSSESLPESAGAGGAGGGAGGSGGAAPVLDPATFDCTAASPPERVSLVPIECALDAACPTRLVTGHRGVGGDLGVIAPENTLAAVRAAVALGVDFVETDPRATADGVLVNMHDPTVDRTTDGTGAVDQMTLADIQALSVDAERFAGDFTCERVPTIAEVLSAAKGKVHVLLDANKTDRVDLLVEAARATDTLEWAVIDTDDLGKIDEAIALEPAILVMIRVANQAELKVALAHLTTHPPILVELHDGASGTELAPAVHASGNRAMTNAFPIDLAAGLDDEPSYYADVFDTGIDVVQTDRPDLVLRFLDR